MNACVTVNITVCVWVFGCWQFATYLKSFKTFVPSNKGNCRAHLSRAVLEGGRLLSMPASSLRLPPYLHLLLLLLPHMPAGRDVYIYI